MGNLVLYAVDDSANARRVLLSLAHDDPNAALKFSHAAGAEFNRSDRAGQAHPELRCIHEVHAEKGPGEFVVVNPATLEPQGESTGDLESLFPAKVVEPISPDRVASEAQLQAMIAKAVNAALAAQAEAIAKQQKRKPTAKAATKKDA